MSLICEQFSVAHISATAGARKVKQGSIDLELKSLSIAPKQKKFKQKINVIQIWTKVEITPIFVKWLDKE